MAQLIIMEIIYQCKYLRHSRYGNPMGFMQWQDVPEFYWNSRKTHKRMIIRGEYFQLVIYPKKLKT